MNTASNIYYDYQLKYIFIGDSGVGKSMLVLRYTDNKFYNEHKATLGVDFGYKLLTVNNHLFNIRMWDTAGSEAFKSVTRSFYGGSTCAVIVYDITKRNTFEHIDEWIKDAVKLCPEKVKLVLIGNKVDLKENRKVSYEEGKSKAEENGMIFYETSAKTGENINEFMNESVKEIARGRDNNVYDLDEEGEACGITKGVNNMKAIMLDGERTDEGDKKCKC